MAIADSGSSLADVEFAADVEEVTFLAYLERPGATAKLQAEAELEAGI